MTVDPTLSVLDCTLEDLARAIVRATANLEAKRNACRQAEREVEDAGRLLRTLQSGFEKHCDEGVLILDGEAIAAGYGARKIVRGDKKVQISEIIAIQSGIVVKAEAFTSPMQADRTHIFAKGDNVVYKTNNGIRDIELKGVVRSHDAAGMVIVDFPEIVDGNVVTHPCTLHVPPKLLWFAHERDQTDLGASDDRPLGPDHPVYRP